MQIVSNISMYIGIAAIVYAAVAIIKDEWEKRRK